MVPLECAVCHKTCRDERGKPYFAETISLSVYDKEGKSGGVLYHLSCIPRGIEATVTELLGILDGRPIET